MEPKEELLSTPREEVDSDVHDDYPESTDIDANEHSDLLNDDPIDTRKDGESYPSTNDPSSLDDATLLAELQRRHLHPQSSVDSTYGQPPPIDPRLAQIVELSYTNPTMAEALRLQIAEERAEARVLERLAPTIGPIAERQALEASGLSESAQKYLTDTFAQMPGINVPALMSNPITRDVLTRAARQFESERASKRAPRFESAASEAPTLSAEDWRAIRDFERLTGDRVDSDVIRNVKRGL